MQVSRCEVCGDARDRDRLVKCPECGRRMCPSHRSATIYVEHEDREVTCCTPCRLDHDADVAVLCGELPPRDLDVFDDHPVFGAYDARAEVP